MKRVAASVACLAVIVALCAWPLAGRSVLARVTPASASTDRAQAAAARALPGLRRDFAAAGLVVGDPVYLRLFKHEREMELWVRKGGGRYVLFRRFPICTYSGALGPKLRQGDGQSPEGFYSVARGQLNPASQYHLAFNLGYPNAYDRAQGRTGDFLMVHGSCVSIGCYAMGDAQIEQIYTVVDAALRGGQRQVPVHVFPFRFDAPPSATWQATTWGPFWTMLREGFDAFESTGVPPRISVVGKRYDITKEAAAKTAAASVSR